jgi:hypothetical protein
MNIILYLSNNIYNMILNQHKLKFIILATTLFLYRTFNYYNSDDAIHANHTMHDELSELLNSNNAFNILQ